MEKLYSTREIADYFNLNIDSVRKMLASGEIKAHKLLNEWRVKESDLKSFLEKCESKAKK